MTTDWSIHQFTVQYSSTD